MNKTIAKSLLPIILKYTHDTNLWANYLPRIPWLVKITSNLGAILLLYTLLFGTSLSNFTKLFFYIASATAFFIWAVTFYLVQWRWQRRSAIRDEMINAIPWQGNEKILDVGCGTGLVLNKAAQKLTTGTALGIDIWKEHGGGGTFNLLIENARLEGVADKIEVKEINAMNMPFKDGFFDAIFSSGAIHHIIHGPEEFEILSYQLQRITKPGGYLIISDITHMIEALALRMEQADWKYEVSDGTSLFRQYEHKLLVAQKPLR